MPPVARNRRVFADPGWDEDGERGERDEEGNHFLETLSGHGQQQHGAYQSTQRRDRDDPLEPRPLTLEFRARAPYRTDPVEHHGHGVGHVGGHRGRPTSSSAGYVATEANPAMLPVRPPSTPAAARRAASHHVIARTRYFAAAEGASAGLVR